MGLKRTLRRSLDRAARAAGVLRLAERGMTGSLTVLMYHRVLPRERAAAYPFPALALPLAAFEAQMRHIAASCSVLPLSAALAELERGGSTRPLVAVTFDDGYADNATLAAPVLEACALRATFFVATAFVAGREPLWYDRAAAAWLRAEPAARTEALKAAGIGAAGIGATRDGAAARQPADAAEFVELLKGRPEAERAALVGRLDGGRMHADLASVFAAMDPAALRTLHRSGHEIGSHSVRHPILTQLGAAELEREVRAARAEIEAWIGEPPAAFCYPNGDQDERVVAAVRAAGHTSACTTRSGRNAAGCDVFRLRRVDVTARRVCRDDLAHDADAFRAELSGLHALLRGAGGAP